MIITDCLTKKREMLDDLKYLAIDQNRREMTRFTVLF